MKNICVNNHKGVMEVQKPTLLPTLCDPGQVTVVGLSFLIFEVEILMNLLQKAKKLRQDNTLTVLSLSDTY